MSRDDPPSKHHERKWHPTDVIAIILAGSMGLALNVFIIAAWFEAREGIFAFPVGLSDNATQVLTGWGGGIIGVIGALVGVRVGRHQAARQLDVPDQSEGYGDT